MTKKIPLLLIASIVGAKLCEFIFRGLEIYWLSFLCAMYFELMYYLLELLIIPILILGLVVLYRRWN